MIMTILAIATAYMIASLVLGIIVGKMLKGNNSELQPAYQVEVIRSDDSIFNRRNMPNIASLS